MPEDVRNMTITTGKPKDVTSTSQLSGQAREGKDWNAKNETKEYVAPSKLGPGSKGGKNS